MDYIHEQVNLLPNIGTKGPEASLSCWDLHNMIQKLHLKVCNRMGEVGQEGLKLVLKEQMANCFTFSVQINFCKNIAPDCKVLITIVS